MDTFLGKFTHDIKCSDDYIIQIIDIPKSINPPHQCLDDGKYYN